MEVRLFLLIATIPLCVCLPASGSASAQTPAPAASRSHVERFATNEARAEKDEADATARLSKNPNDAGTLNVRARARMQLGRYQEAQEDLRRAVTLNPSNADYLANLGYALYRLGRAADAVAAERAALKLDANNFTAHYQLGRFLLLGGDPKLLPEAASHLKRALELDPRRSEVRFDLLTAYRALGDAPNAIAQLNLLQDARPSDPRVAYAEALLASDRGDMNEAIKGFRQTLTLDPNQLGALQDLGLAYIKLSKWPEAIEALADLSKRRADSVEAAYFHAIALFNAGRAAEAESETRRALRLEAGAAAAHTLLGIILASKGGADPEAIESLTQAVALDPNSFDAQFYLGRVQYSALEYQAAAKALAAAVKLNPKHVEARFFLGTALEGAGNSDAALSEYQEIVRLAPESAFGQTGLGALLVKQGKLNEAIEALRRATSIDPKSFEAHWALGRALALAERYPEAIESFQAAVAIIPDRSDAHYQLGLALRRAGRAEEAAREFKIVEKINAEFRARSRSMN
ncbi:MAG TPA: tetratricopeptide repeat protein [Blastocatellia bacterium]|nr:tetratricopeptide repeat protein [Blastocatellia bacterium]